VEPAPEAGGTAVPSGLEGSLRDPERHSFSCLRGCSSTGTMRPPQGHKGAPPRWGGRFFMSLTGGNTVEEWTTAKDLIACIEQLTLHTMTKLESGKLHEQLNGVRIGIEELWAKWDDPEPR